MKNVKEWQKKTCIFMETEEFDDIIRYLFGKEVETEYSLEGIWIGYQNGDAWIDEAEIESGLAEFFDVKEVTSIHIDDWDPMGVWICYRD